MQTGVIMVLYVSVMSVYRKHECERLGSELWEVLLCHEHSSDRRCRTETFELWHVQRNAIFFGCHGLGSVPSVLLDLFRVRRSFRRGKPRIFSVLHSSSGMWTRDSSIRLPKITCVFQQGPLFGTKINCRLFLKFVFFHFLMCCAGLFQIYCSKCSGWD